MKIESIDAWLAHHPLPEAFYPSWIPGYPQTRNSCLIVRVRTDEGIDGWAAGVGFLDEAKGIPSVLRPFLMGRDPFQVENFVQIARSGYFLGYKLWFVEVALWDIIGKAAGLPVYKLLGGGEGKIAAYASCGEIRQPEKRAEDALKLKEAGYKALKLRIRSHDMQTDLDQVEKVREAVGDDMEIMVDANQGWPIHGFADYPRWTLKRAMDTCVALEELGVRWVEEPLFKHDYDGYATLRQSTTLPIAGGEFNTDLHEFRDLMAKGCLDIVQPDVTLSGGILMGKKIAGISEAYNLRFSPHTWTNGLGLAANLQLIAATPNCPYCEFPYEEPAWIPEHRDFMLTEPILPDAEGYITAPDKPGLGVEVNPEAVEKVSEKL